MRMSCTHVDEFNNQCQNLSMYRKPPTAKLPEAYNCVDHADIKSARRLPDISGSDLRTWHFDGKLRAE